MSRSTRSTIASLFSALLVASALLLTGCSDSLTGPQQADEAPTVQQADTTNED